MGDVSTVGTGDATPRPEVISTYRRTVGVSLERVWENVLDWEHLPWLHSSSFVAIECLAAGSWGWHARIVVPPGELRNASTIELRRVEGEERYIVRTLEGVGVGTEIETRVDSVSHDQTRITVDFRVPGLASPAKRAALGERYIEVYTQLWDEDEAMMRRRERGLAASTDPAPSPERISLGAEAALRAKLPLEVDFGDRPVRVVEQGGRLVAYSTRCPHWLGPLGLPDPESGRISCPWHGYAFDLETGRSCDGHALRLGRAPRVEIESDGGEVFLVGPAAGA